jgi:hypothetical protein
MFFFLVDAKKNCFIVKPSEKDLQKSVGDVYSSIGTADYDTATQIQNDNLKRLGTNTEKTQAMKITGDAFHYALKHESRSSESDMADLAALADAFIKAHDEVVNSQDGFENFKTDSSKLNDPFYAEFYKLYNASLASIHRVVADPSLVDDFYSQNAADLAARLIIETHKISQSALVNKD